MVGAEGNAHGRPVHRGAGRVMTVPGVARGSISCAEKTTDSRILGAVCESIEVRGGVSTEAEATEKRATSENG